MRWTKPVLVAVSAACLSLPLASLRHRTPSAQTDYETELARIQRETSELKESAFAAPIDIEKATRFVHRLNHRAYLTGSPADLKAAETAIDRAIREVGPLATLYLLKANLDFKFHRLERAGRDLAALSKFGGNAQVVALNASLAFQEGGYEDARRGYQRAIGKNPTWDNLARLAHWESKF